MISSAFIILLLTAAPTVDSGSEAGLRQAELVEGMPDFPPLTRKYQDGWHAALSPGYTFVWIDKVGDREELFFVLHRTEKGSSLSQMSLAPSGPHLEGRHKAGVESGMERVLRLRLKKESRVVGYEWLTEKSTVLFKGEKISNEELHSLDGTSFTVSELRGKWIVLNWWATFCVPCREEIPSLNRLVESRAADDIVFLAVALDEPETLKRFLRKHPFQYRQSFGGARLERAFGDQFPRHLVIAPDGTIVGDVVGGSSDVAKVLGEEIDRARGRISTKR